VVEQEQLNKLRSYIAGIISGEREDFDFVDIHECEVLRRRSLALVLLEYQVAGKRIWPARENRPADLLHIVERARSANGMSKKDLAVRSGISRGHVTKLLSESGRLSANPTLETLVRFAIAIGWPLKIADLEPAPEPEPASAPESKGVQWKKVGVYGASTVLGVGVIASIVNYVRSRSVNGSKGSA
jgi:transcriptional regulator with XRE-family HTH domain